MAAACPRCSAALPESARFCSECGAPIGPDGSGGGDEIRLRLEAAVEGEFIVTRELGRGSMGVAYLARQVRLDRHVVLKVLLPNAGTSHDLTARFRQEARTQSKLLHPHIVPILDVREAAGLLFISMPYIDGPNLRVWLDEEPRPPIARVERILKEVGEALAFSHRLGIVHRDVKPENILIDRSTEGAFLADFGIAKVMGPDQTALTLNFTQLGTPRYMAPEQWENAFRIDGRSDQYGLGLIGWEMLAGRQLFDAQSTLDLYNQQKSTEPPSLDVLRPDASVALRSTVMRSIQREREDRFGSMEEFLASLAGTLVAPPAPAPAPASARPTDVAAPTSAGAGPEASPPSQPAPTGVPVSSGTPPPLSPPSLPSSPLSPAPLTAPPPAAAAHSDVPVSPAPWVTGAPPKRRKLSGMTLFALVGLALSIVALSLLIPRLLAKGGKDAGEVTAVVAPNADSIAAAAAQKPKPLRKPAATPSTPRATSQSNPSGTTVRTDPAPPPPVERPQVPPPPQQRNMGGPNAKPFASFTYSPKHGRPDTQFTLDASGSRDDRDPTDRLEVRWDFDNDGRWDTDFSTAKRTTVRFNGMGKRLARLQVRDSAGQTSIHIDGPTISR